MQKSNMSKIGMAIPTEMREKLESVAAEQDRNLSWIVRKAIEEYLANHYDFEDEDKE